MSTSDEARYHVMPASRRPRLPTGDLITSALGLGPIPWRYLPAVRSLFAERARIRQLVMPEPQAERPSENTGARPTDPKTALEVSLRIKPTRRADIRLNHAAHGRLASRTRQLTTLAARRDAIRDEIQRTDQLTCADRPEETISLKEAWTRARELAQTIHRAENEGSHKHDELTAFHRRVLPLFVVFDALLLVYFMTEVFNIGWRDFYSVDIWVRLFQSILLAAVLTGSVTVTVDRFGRTHRAYREDDGELHYPHSAVVAVQLVMVLIAAVIPSVLIGVRVYIDTFNAYGSSNLSWTAALGSAIMMLFVNLMVYHGRATDGSRERDRLKLLNAQVAFAALRKEQLTTAHDRVWRQMQSLVSEIDRDDADLDQLGTKLRDHPATARTILYVRGTTGTIQNQDPRLLLLTLPENQFRSTLQTQKRDVFDNKIGPPIDASPIAIRPAVPGPATEG